MGLLCAPGSSPFPASQMLSAPAEFTTEIQRGPVALTCHALLVPTRDEAAIGSSTDGSGAQM